MKPTTMSNRLAGAALIAALTLTSATKAAEDEAHRIANNFSHENLICGVYH